jgi:prevent-host-death family protein
MSMDIKEKSVPAGYFKQHCLSIMDEVAATHQPVVVSKRGKPTVRIVPIAGDDEIERHVLARLRSGEGGMLVSENELLKPTSLIAGWKDE